MNLALLELEPEFLRRVDDTHFQRVETMADADGVIFVCPKCFVANGKRRPGVHSVICWQPRVPQSTKPGPGRWRFEGTGLDNLTLVARSSSILLTPPGCGWHGYIRNGRVTNA